MDELYFGLPDEDLFLAHYGKSIEDGAPGRGSGRYPKGSGENPNQHVQYKAWSYEETQKLRQEGLSDKEIAEFFGITQADFRRKQSVAKNEKIAQDRALVMKLRNKDMSFRAIEEKTGISASQARALLKDHVDKKLRKEQETMDILRKEIEEKGHIDVGSGTEQYLGISDTKLKQMVKTLQDEGYVLSHPKVEQAGTGYDTSLLVLSKKDTPKGYIYNHIDEIKTIEDLHVVDDGEHVTVKPMHPPVSLDSSRLQVVYAEEGGKEKDGLIELRRGVDDISLGKSDYAQVRICVDGKHYLKGMAVYSDATDWPDGVDIKFNTNKHVGTPIMNEDPNGKSVLKPMKGEGVDGFGATIRRQNDWVDADGNEHQGLVNIVKDAGAWGDQQRTLASQMLSKQSPELAKRQLSLDFDVRKQQYDDICALTNPAVKQKMLYTFAEECDAAAVHLKGAAMPRQAWNVIIPMPSLKDNEIYAPQFKDGETVVCIRYPHEGKYQIPQLIVNNRNAEGKSILGNTARDAVGINSKVAEKLSGADFDGDTVLVIPNNAQANGKRLIQTAPSLKDMEGYDAKDAYPGYPGMKVMTHAQTQKEMGIISNLITDMTLQGATDSELARATKHAQCVIDAEKHKLNWRLSEKQNAIQQLKDKYQPKNPETGEGGAQTLLSRAKNPTYVNRRKKNQEYTIDPETGKKIWNESDPWYDREGNPHYYQQKSYKMYETDDARTLISKSNTKIENVYADYANNCKRLADKARYELKHTPNQEYNKEAAKEYAQEVNELKSQLNTALKNSPRERQAQILAYSNVKTKIAARKAIGEEPTKSDIRKWTAQEIEPARKACGAKKKRVTFTDRQWEAIQKGAIPHTQLVKLLNNADEADYKSRATPKERKVMTSAKIAKAKSLAKAGYTMAEIADYLGVSASTVGKEINA